MSGTIRISSGTAKGRKVSSVSGRLVRPTSARVREAMFSVLAERVEGARILDLYAGVGTLGLEALSRGAEHVDFIDNNPRHAAMIRTNLRTLDFVDRGRVWVRDVVTHLRRARGSGPYDLILLDPPYHDGALAAVLPLLLRADIISPDGLLVVEYEVGSGPTGTYGWHPGHCYRYGKTEIALFYPPNATTD